MMQLKIYNTLGRKKENFVPREEWKVKIYSCGPTVYYDPHIWNFRSFIFASLWGDLFRALGYEVSHTMNITDVWHLTDDGDHGEDKMEKWARKEWITAWDVARKYESNFREYIKKLNIYFDNMPRATDHIQWQIDIVKMLEDKWYTYEITWDGIYMDTSKVKWYGKLLPKWHLEWIQSGERVEDVGKRNPTDFALWKFNVTGKARDMERESPRWIGFPGRHIECSAMARATLGDFIDIHTGGIDHVPVHHTDEIAQSECSFTDGKQWVNYWIHNQFLNIDSQKIAKSAWNSFSLPEIENRWYDPLDLRYFFFQAHYRSFQDFTWEGMEAARRARKNLKKRLQMIIEDSWGFQNIAENLKMDVVKSAEDLRDGLKDEWVKIAFDKIWGVLLDDLDVVKMMANLNTAVSDVLKSGKNIDMEGFLKVIYWLDSRVLKLGLFKEDEDIEIPEEVSALAKARREAKLSKNYDLADELREKLEKLWWEMLDGKDGYQMKRQDK